MKGSLIIIIIILFAGSISPSQAQQLASEKPVASLYSKTTSEKLREKNNDRQPAAQKARQELPSQQSVQQASVPARIKPKQQGIKRKAVSQQLPSQKPILLPNVHAKKVVGPALPARREH